MDQGKGEPMSKSKYPKQIYVQWNDEHELDKPLLIATEEAEAHAVIGEVIEVAVYRLDRVGHVRTTVEAP